MPFKSYNNNNVVKLMIICIAILIRWTISLNSYSGAGKAPMYGDYEAQRHWMEITYNLPIQDWYKNTTDNDLEYWGLDYPPLTAYHSWFCGFIQSKINSSWIELHSSRGLETPQHKLFMRYSVLLMDILIYVPSLFAFFGQAHKKDDFVMLSYLILALLYPGLMLIDYGHFQYNCISLGLKIWAVFCLTTDRNIIGSILFVLSLNYKQMQLYHSIPFFSYLLGSIIRMKESLLTKMLNLMLLSIIVISTFVICWLPFLFSFNDILNVLKRLFPVGRGLFEDKVSNFWCSISIIVKLKNLFTNTEIIRICSVITLISVLPSSINLFRKPSIQKFKYSLFNCSLAFFLFSYHVHEKTILLPASSILLLIPNYPLESVWFLIISTFSMFPLFVKDGLIFAFIASSILFLMIFEITNYLFDLVHLKTKVYFKLMNLSLLGSSCIGTALLLLPTPTNLPHIYLMIHSIYCCGHFICFLVYFNWRQLACDDQARITSNNFTLLKKKIL